MDQNEVITLVKAYKDLLDDFIVYKSVYLFGSYAKNSFKEHSDIDVAIVVEKLDSDFLELNMKLWKLRRKIDVRIEPKLIISNNDLTGMLEEVQKTGILIN
jgi:predicted nucleotidyltransferase